MSVFVRPNFDKVSEFSFKWCEKLIKDLGIKDFVDLAGNLATRENTEKALKENPSADFIFYNHGDKQGLLAQNGEGYIIDKRNSSALQRRVAYSMACLWCSDGGADAYRKGAKIVWGYKDAFSFMAQAEEIYGRLANMGLLLVKNDGLSWRQAYEKVIEAFNEEIRKAETGDPWVEITLINDRDALVCWATWNEPSTETFLEMIIRMILNFLRRIFK